MRRKLLLTLGILLLVLALVVPVLAQTYYADIIVTETAGTDYDMYPLRTPLNTSALVSNGYITASGLDTRVLETTTELSFMLADDKLLFADNVNGSSSQQYQLTTGNAAATSFDIITGYGGYVTVTNDSDLDPGGVFDIAVQGYILTDVAGNLVYRDDSFILESDGVGNIDLTLPGAVAAWTTPSSIVSSPGWTNPNNAIDDDTGTFAWYQVPQLNWSAYITIDTPDVATGGFRYWVTESLAVALTVDIDAYYSAAWNDFYEGVVGTYGNWQERIGVMGVVEQYRMRFYNPDAGFAVVVNLHETDFGEAPALTVATTNREQEVAVTADGANLSLVVTPVVGAPVSDTMAWTGSVYDSNNDWVLMSNAMPSMDYYTHEVGGVLIAWYQPVGIISGTTLPDRQGAAEDGVITWGANSAGIAVTMGGLYRLDTATTAPEGQDPSAAPSINPPADLYSDPLDITGPVWLQPIMTWVANPTSPTTGTSVGYDLPVSLFWTLLAVIIMLLMTVVAFHFSQNMLITGAVLMTTSGGLVAMGLLTPWILLITGMIMIGTIAMEKASV